MRVPEPGTLHGSGLVLRPWRPDAVEDVAAWRDGMTDAEFLRWNTPANLVATMADAEQSLRRRVSASAAGTAPAWCVTDEGTAAILGQVGIHRVDASMRSADVGFWLLPAARGRGIAASSLELVCGWAYEVAGLYRLGLVHAVGNEASCAVARRCGFAFEGTLRGRMSAGVGLSGFRDAHQHARLASD